MQKQISDGIGTRQRFAGQESGEDSAVLHGLEQPSQVVISSLKDRATATSWTATRARKSDPFSKPRRQTQTRMISPFGASWRR
jgi:hypothetical protein